MGKFLSAVLLALACTAHAADAAPQAGVRVGPEAEEGGRTDNAPKAEEKRPADPKASEARREPARATATPPPATASAATPAPNGASNAASDAPARPGPIVGVPVNNTNKAAEPAERPAAQPANNNNAAPPAPAAPAVALTSIYRIGVGDILDIRLLNQPDSRLSTLYTVLAGGLIEYPLIRDHIAAAGMTPDELAAQLVAELRHRGVFERPQVRVSVREYASHAVLVSGLVGDPGTKILRREAVPLYVVVAEAQPRPEAGRAVVISHATGKTSTVDLLDAAGMNLLVQQGDVISLTARPPEFFYVGGEIAAPGQKSFHAGMTLTQAVLASGGVTAQAGPRVRVSRQGPDGRLVAAEYNLREIEGGAVPDPVLQPGDRIEVVRGNSRK